MNGRAVVPALSVALALSLAAGAARAATGVTPPLPPPTHPRSAAIFRRYAPAIVLIRTEGPRCQTAGTGFFISPDGLIATNKHVVDCALRKPGHHLVLRVPDELPKDPGLSYEQLRQYAHTHAKEYTRYRVATCGSTKARDLCVLKLELYPPRHFRVGEEFPPEGGEVFTIGNPGGKGIALSHGRYLRRRNHDGVSEIDTTVPTIGGNSGGPIFTADGRLAGVHYMYRATYAATVPKQLRQVQEERDAISSFELDRLVQRFFESGAVFRSPADFSANVAPALDW